MMVRDIGNMGQREIEERMARAQLRAEQARTSQEREHQLGMAGYWAEVLADCAPPPPPAAARKH